MTINIALYFVPKFHVLQETGNGESNLALLFGEV